MNLWVRLSSVWSPRWAQVLRLRALRTVVLVGFGSSIAVGCQIAPVPVDTPTIAETPVWPAPPARARIRWVAEIRVPADLGIRPGVFRRLWNRFVGVEVPRMVRPHSVAVDGLGRLWVTDPGARRVHIFDPDRGRYEFLPRDGDPPLASPIAVVHDPRGVAYVSDSGRGVIRRFDPAGNSLAEWDGDGEFVRPTGLAFDADQDLLWVSDTGSHRILALDSRGVIRRFVGERGEDPGRFNFPTHLTLGPSGQLYVSDTLNFRVQILSAQGEALSTFGQIGDGPGSLSKPKGIGLDRDGHVYVVDAHFDNVQIFDQEGNTLLYFGDRGSGPGQFWLPAGLTVVDGNRIYVADSYNNRIQVFEYLGE